MKIRVSSTSDTLGASAPALIVFLKSRHAIGEETTWKQINQMASSEGGLEVSFSLRSLKEMGTSDNIQSFNNVSIETTRGVYVWA